MTTFNRPQRWWALLGMGLIATSTLTGCAAFERMDFVQDDSLVITSPENLSSVRLPFEVTWDITADAPRARYAVFVDRHPMAPGNDLRSVVDELSICRGNDDCLKPDSLARLFGVHVTEDTHAEIASIPTGLPNTGSDAHYATIVRLDDNGRRLGEAVWYVSFQVDM